MNCNHFPPPRTTSKRNLSRAFPLWHAHSISLPRRSTKQMRRPVRGSNSRPRCWEQTQLANRCKYLYLYAPSRVCVYIATFSCWEIRRTYPTTASLLSRRFLNMVCRTDQFTSVSFRTAQKATLLHCRHRRLMMKRLLFAHRRSTYPSLSYIPQLLMRRFGPYQDGSVLPAGEEWGYMYDIPESTVPPRDTDLQYLLSSVLLLSRNGNYFVGRPDAQLLDLFPGGNLNQPSVHSRPLYSLALLIRGIAYSLEGSSPGCSLDYPHMSSAAPAYGNASDTSSPMSGASPWSALGNFYRDRSYLGFPTMLAPASVSEEGF
jgi:hypothetical protein